AEAAPPEPVRKDGDSTDARLRVLLREEEPAALGLEAEDVEELARHELPRDQLGAVALPERDRDRAMDARVREGALALRQVGEVRVGERQQAGVLRIGRVECDQTVRILDRQGGEEERVQKSENQSIRADAEGERRDRRGGEAGILGEG